MGMKVVERIINGKKISIESGRIAKQAAGSAVVRCGDTMVLVTACSGADKDGDFFPLTIDYVEKTYAGGKIPGGFFKREGKLSERETLVSRLIDRPCRPLFPEGYSKEVQVVATVMSSDGENDADVLAVCGASAALTISELPFQGPIAAVRVGRVKGKLIVNPTVSELRDSELNFVVAGTRDAIVMVEGGAQEVPESEVLEALFFAHKEMQSLIDMQVELQKEIGKAKSEFKPKERDEAFVKSVEAWLKPKMDKAVRVKEKLTRRDEISKLKESMGQEFVPATLQESDPKKAASRAAVLSKVFEDTMYHAVRGMAFKEKVRIDGRDFKTVRPISIELNVLPRTHGSALFTRGETQAIVVTTLGTKEEAQRLDSLLGESSKTFMLHYNFPPFSVGETKPMRGPGRREIGHGALAERAVKVMMPSESAFPYVVRVVSEVTESNGSSSMATVCGSSLALMAAGVPIKSPVAGVAMGLMNEGNDFVILTDILGDEDHLGDMDFKVCGTRTGITALQMDIKIAGLKKEVVDQALGQAREARMFILDQMGAIISQPNSKLSQFAPRIVTIKINPDRIRDVIGPGGKTIRSITESCGVKMEVTDDGTVNVSSNDEGKIESAIKIIKSLTEEAEVGKIYRGVVKRIADFGAFVEILPGTDGLVHISQLSDQRVRSVEDVVQEGDEVTVKVLEIDRQGKIRLSMKEAMDDMSRSAS